MAANEFVELNAAFKEADPEWRPFYHDSAVAEMYAVYSSAAANENAICVFIC